MRQNLNALGRGFTTSRFHPASQPVFIPLERLINRFSPAKAGYRNISAMRLVAASITFINYKGFLKKVK